ncbi:PAS domain-containing sensor histidine kinase [Kiloniella laminariae]|uniref:sensor histidine kinase n=1 Tax=Kiloniella laminariae TaxID=454162 RepID=UPI000377FDE4|nr:PAS domain-containing sensor histidine kinase [Kiloniella laminariae]
MSVEIKGAVDSLVPAPEFDDKNEAAVLILSKDALSLVETNARAVSMLGYNPQELRALSPTELLFEKPVNRSPKSCFTQGDALILRHANGQKIFCKSTFGEIVIAAKSRLVITLSPETPKERNARIDALLRLAVGQMPDAMIVYDMDDRLLYFNQAYRQIFSYMPPLEELAGKHFFDIIRITMKVPGVVMDPLCHSDPEAYLAKRLERLHHPTAGMFEQPSAGGWHLIHEQRIPGVGFVSLRRDITRDRQLHDEMTAANRRLEEAAGAMEKAHAEAVSARISAEQANRAKSEFLAMMSHELRTPLNAIIGFSSVMQQEIFGPVGNVRYQEYPAMIKDSGSHLLAIINDILDLAKIEAGKMELDRQWMDGNALIVECARLMSGLALSRDVVIELYSVGPDGTVMLDIDKDIPLAEQTASGGSGSGKSLFYADARMSKQMVVNLLSNACKFTPAGGSIRLSYDWTDADSREIGVEDTGIGMSPADIALALQPFRQVADVSVTTESGTGLGLPLVKSFVEMHGGQLKIDSRPGQGTTARLRFPVGSKSEVKHNLSRDR